MKHDQFVVTIKFEVCEGMKAKALEELKVLRLFVLGNTYAEGKKDIKGVFDHAQDVKFHVDHTEIV